MGYLRTQKGQVLYYSSPEQFPHSWLTETYSCSCFRTASGCQPPEEVGGGIGGVVGALPHLPDRKLA